MDLIEDDEAFHVGHFIRKYMSLRPDDVAQIDAATGEAESKRSVLSRSTRLAQALRRRGLRPGDVVALGGRNHLDVHIPFYAGHFNGLPIAGVDPLYKYEEIKYLFNIIRPKIAFCEPDSYEDFSRAVRELDLETLIVTFRGGPYSMQRFMQDYRDPEPEQQFQVAAFDLRAVHAWLVSTSGTTGAPKVAAVPHKVILGSLEFFLVKPKDKELRAALNVASMQWMSACFHALATPVYHVKVQTSAPTTADHVAHIIDKYRPRMTVTTPTLIARVLKTDCDLTCFDVIALAGSKTHNDFLAKLKSRVREDTQLPQAYGQTESCGIVVHPTPDTPFGALGKKTSRYEVKLVNPDTGEVVAEPRVAGELWVRGPRIAEYYNDPKATAEAFTQDGWYKTGDLLYRDENDFYYFVDRLKMLIKYRNYQIVPPEIEDVILEHPGVADVCVSSVEHAEDGERVVACVVRRPQRAGAGAAPVTAPEIKDLVAGKLSVHKQLHGGVVFLDKIPLTSTDKVARHKVREIVKTARIE